MQEWKRWMLIVAGTNAIIAGAVVGYYTNNLFALHVCIGLSIFTAISAGLATCCFFAFIIVVERFLIK